MARVVCKKAEASGTTPFFINIPVPTGAKLLKIDVNDPTTAGGDFSIELSASSNIVGGGSSISLMHHEKQGKANKNITWESTNDWTVEDPFSIIVVLVDGVLPTTDVIAVTVTYGVD